MTPKDEQQNPARYLKYRSIDARDREKKIWLTNVKGSTVDNSVGECATCSYSPTILHTDNSLIHHNHRSLKLRRLISDLEKDGTYSCSCATQITVLTWGREEGWCFPPVCSSTGRERGKE